MRKQEGATITDEQLHALRCQASGSTVVLLDPALVELCDMALGWTELEPCLNTHPGHDCIAAQRAGARARCAAILNARSVK